MKKMFENASLSIGTRDEYKKIFLVRVIKYGGVECKAAGLMVKNPLYPSNKFHTLSALEQSSLYWHTM